ncbi:YncE family protein [Gordonia zhaorongruii]|uniref:YncE family protein n=1 Tax=Gordonia zhaorongruii TaxID=2597659 RepID=UPI0010434F06|nr:YncE family protein [Gordonia zhaorongruii]
MVRRASGALKLRRAVPRAAGAALLLTALSAPAAFAAPDSEPGGGLREVLFVGNNWEGTADVIEAAGSYRKVGRINAVPDKEKRLAEIRSNPAKLGYFLGIRETVGEGHDQYVDDLYSTADGGSIVLSRPSFADVVSIDTSSGKVNWRFPVAGFRADHMAMSPDGKTVAVSASTSNTVHVIDVASGTEKGRFATGDKPHENLYSQDGKYIWNMAIGDVNTPLDAPSLDFTKGDRYITVVDTATFERVRKIDMRKRLDAFGRKDLSDSVRPVAFTPDEDKLYFQVSFFNGFVEYDIPSDKITRIKELPKNPETDPARISWVNDSRHHGLSMSPDGDKLCVAGTMDDYATIVDRRTLRQGPLVPVSKPYWATVNGDGTACIVSESGSDSVSAIDFSTGRKVADISVGDHPQRVRLGVVPADWNGTAD